MELLFDIWNQINDKFEYIFQYPKIFITIGNKYLLKYLYKEYLSNIQMNYLILIMKYLITQKSNYMYKMIVNH